MSKRVPPVPQPPPPPQRMPLWAGPSGPGPQGGVTFSMLSKFLSCRERFRCYAIEGLRPVERFDHKIEYGNMWHVCEEHHAKGGPLGDAHWQENLASYCADLCTKYPTQQAEIDKWYRVCKVQFPVYVAHWSQHPDMRGRTPLLAEQVFDVPYTLPSGRTVRLRGKWDSVDLVDGGFWLIENKTKGDIDREQLTTQLTFDLQTMLYIVALIEDQSLHSLGERGRFNVKGVRYNVVRRPLSGGTGTIVQKQNEGVQAFYNRLRGYIDGTGEDGKGNPTPGPDHYFQRWNIPVSTEDIATFRATCLDPILEAVCNWYTLVSREGNLINVTHLGTGLNWRHPYGVVNWIDAGYGSAYDTYLNTGSTVGLDKVETLFRELET